MDVAAQANDIGSFACLSVSKVLRIRFSSINLRARYCARPRYSTPGESNLPIAGSFRFSMLLVLATRSSRAALIPELTLKIRGHPSLPSRRVIGPELAQLPPIIRPLKL